MALPVAARIPLIAGLIGLALSVLNQLTAGFADPALQRAGVLASILSVVLMLVGLLWTRITPEAAQRASLHGEEGLRFAAGLSEPLRRELAWGSSLLLTASPAATLLLLWNDNVLLRRGLLPPGAAAGDPFPPGRSAARPSSGAGASPWSICASTPAGLSSSPCWQGCPPW